MEDKNRKEHAKSRIELLAKSREAARDQSVNLWERVKRGQDYYNNRQPVHGFQYNNYRDKTVFRNVNVFHSLLTANQPKYSFMPREPWDVPLANVFNKVDEYFWSKKGIALKYKHCIKDMLKYGTGIMLPLVTEREGGYDIDIEVPIIGVEFLVGDWATYSISDQPWCCRRIVMSKSEIERLWPDIKTNVDDQDWSWLDLLHRSFKKISGSETMLEKIYDKEEMKNLAACGNMLVDEFWYKNEEGEVYKEYLIAGQCTEAEETDYPDYPFCVFRYHPQNRQFCGMSEVDISSEISDVRTTLMQNMLIHDSLFGKGIILFSSLLGKSAAEIQDLLRRPGSAIKVDHQVFTTADGGLKFIQPEPLPQSKLMLMDLSERLADMDSGNSNWLQGTVAAGSDPASKVAYLQQAGLQRIKTQASYNDEDGLRHLGTIMLWYYQTYLDSQEVIRIVGETNADGSPKFIDLNIPLTMEDVATLEAKAMQAEAIGGTVTFQNTEFAPDELLMQIQMIKKAVEEAKAAGTVPTLLLNDTSAGNFDIDIADSDALPFNESQKKSVIGMLASAGMATPTEVRETYGLPVDPNSISKLKNGVPIIPVEDLAGQYEQSLQSPETQGQFVNEMLAHIDRLQKVVQS